MPTISGRHNRRQVLFDVAVVGVTERTESVLSSGAPAFSVLSEPVKALLDTGATNTSISPQAVQRLGLSFVGRKHVVTANGYRRAKCFSFRVAMINLTADPGAAGSPFFVLPDPIAGTELNADQFTFDILLGMDVISQGDLTIRRDGSFTFEF